MALCPLNADGTRPPTVRARRSGGRTTQGLRAPGGVSPATTFQDRLRNHPVVFEVVPPHRRASEATVRNLVTRVVQAVKSLPRVDAVNVPEVLDENHVGAPFYRNLDPREFAMRLRDRADLDIIVNKLVIHLASAQAFRNWLTDTLSVFGLRNVVCVGGTSHHVQYPGPTVVEANRIFRDEARAANRADATCGNITIPDRPSEAARLLAKTRAGCQFATTQVLFEAAKVRALLAEYDAACRAADVEPATVLLSFAPVSDYADLEFLRWLGAPISEEFERQLLDDRGGPAEASIRVAVDLWREIRGFAERGRFRVPIGINVEVISAHNFDHAVEMARQLAAAEVAARPA